MVLLQDEFEMNMRLLGARNISELVPEMVDASALHSHVGLTPNDNLYNATCAYRSNMRRTQCSPVPY